LYPVLSGLVPSFIGSCTQFYRVLYPVLSGLPSEVFLLKGSFPALIRLAVNRHSKPTQPLLIYKVIPSRASESWEEFPPKLELLYTVLQG